MGQFYGEISVIFFLSFRLKTALLFLFGVFVSTSREREKNVSFREEQRLFLLFAFLSRRLAVLFFRRKKTSRAAF